jgi:hypothetical protein
LSLMLLRRRESPATSAAAPAGGAPEPAKNPPDLPELAAAGLAAPAAEAMSSTPTPAPTPAAAQGLRGRVKRALLAPLSRPFLEIAAVVLASFLFFLGTGAYLQSWARMYRSDHAIPWPVWVVSAGAAVGAWLLLAGKRRLFAVALPITLILTAGDFNPLSRGFAPLESSSMYEGIKLIRDFQRNQNAQSMWLVSGGPSVPNIGTMAAAMGVHTLTGVFYHPQLDQWRVFDPDGLQAITYNRYAEIHYAPLAPGDTTVQFVLATPGSFNVRMAPDHPALKKLNVGFALTLDRHWPYDAFGYERVYESRDRRLRIWKLK